MVVSADELRCPLCKVTFRDKGEFEQHKSTPQHRGRWLMHWYQRQRALLASNKNGVEVLCERLQANMGYDEVRGTISVLLNPGEVKEFTVVIKNSSKESPIILRMIESLVAARSISVKDEHGVTQNAKFVRILPNIEYAINCRVEGATVGVESVPYAFQFKAEDDSIFFIVRTIEINVVDSIARDAGPVSEYEKIPLKLFSQHSRNIVIPGIPLEREQPSYSRNKINLEQYHYRGTLKSIAAKNFDVKKVAQSEAAEAARLRQLIREGLNQKNYQEWFQIMLWIEEMQMELDIQYYSMPDAKMKKVPTQYYNKAQCVELEVLGLAERRPSVLKGDSVFVTLKGTRKPVYEGVVHQVNDKSIYLAFDPQFMSTFVDGMRFSVEFTFNRYPLRVSHRAVVLSKELSLFNLTFPTVPASNQPFMNILAFNRKIESNAEQMEAVRNIVTGTSKPAPYIIFGPPGTGKTVTVVEAIKQVHRQNPTNRILASAPSNSAVDLIAKRLLEHIPKSHMLRMYAQSHYVNAIPPELLEIANLENKNICFVPEEKLKGYRIILCTFVTASRIASASLPPGHISHVFLDECGHAMEPECLTSLAGIIENDGQVVLAGDPYQLGPVIRNPQCFSSGRHFTNNGLDKSFLERLIEMDMYRPTGGQFNRKVVTKLLNNYRSHRDILTKSNEMFYENELKPCADQILVNSLCGWEHLPKRNFPLIFHGVRGKDEREGKSPSYFNPLEVSKVVEYTRKLLDSRNPKIYGREIGIITPYRRQVEKIRDQLKKDPLKILAKDIKVGSPEEFQGDERRVIIISTVRASAEQLSYDEVFRLGFLRNPKRFNVAVTRAKALLIVVGCPEILQLDKNWNMLLTFIREKGGYCGARMLEEDQNFSDILSRFDKLNLRPVVGAEQLEEVSVREFEESPEWRQEY